MSQRQINAAIAAEKARPYTGEHVIDYVSHRLDYWFAECSCGWKGPERLVFAGAEADGNRHAFAVEATR